MNSDFTGNIRENKVFDERRRKSTITKILSSVAGLSTRLDERKHLNVNISSLYQGTWQKITHILLHESIILKVYKNICHQLVKRLAFVALAYLIRGNENKMLMLRKSFGNRSKSEPVLLLESVRKNLLVKLKQLLFSMLLSYRTESYLITFLTFVKANCNWVQFILICCCCFWKDST